MSTEERGPNPGHDHDEAAVMAEHEADEQPGASAPEDESGDAAEDRDAPDPGPAG